jgi:4-hydroxybenzoate polyprenyltransferase
MSTAQVRPSPVDDISVLFVDADGNLYSADILHESVARCLVRNPVEMLKVPYWLLKGRAYLKAQVAALADIDFATLPYRQDVIEFLHSEAAKGRTLVLATAAHEKHARAIAEQLGLFHHVLATRDDSNLKGQAKADAIAEYCRSVNQPSFSYIGDAHSDLHVWRHASSVYAVTPGWRLQAKIRALGKPTQLVGVRRSRVWAAVKALRPQQWAKNLLIFVPLVTSHRALEWPLLLQCLVAFVAFSLSASAVYVANDLVDIDADRQHPRKRERPFASGTLPIAFGPPLVLALLTAGLGIATTVSASFVAIIGVYLAMNIAYSFLLKRKLLADVVALALMYSIRIISGGEATGIVISEWLFAFSLFFFTSLALVKRHAELVVVESLRPHRPANRAYRAGDVRIIEGLGTSSGLVAVLVLALYIASPEVKLLYSSPQVLWLLCPLLYFWIARVWILSGRRQLHHDPVVFAMTDWRSLATWCLGACILFGATYF